MQVTIDIPEPLVKELETSARANDISLQEIVVRGALREGRRYLSHKESELARTLREGGSLNDVMFMSDDEFQEFAGH